jgi:hypothetical protein
MTEFINFLPFVILAGTLILFLAKVWHWRDAAKDWAAAKTEFMAGRTHESVYTQARGLMRLAWLQLVIGVVWAGIGLAAYANRNILLNMSTVRASGRVLTCVLVLLELVRLFTERWTRFQVTIDVDREADIKRRR